MIDQLVTLALLHAVSAQEFQLGAVKEVISAFELAGRKAPQVDAELSKAANLLSADAATRGAKEAADPVAIAEAVSDSGAYDPNPRTLIVRGAPPEEALRALRERRDLAQEPATHVGVGISIEGERAAIVVLAAQRKLSLQAMPRNVAKVGTTTPLCIQLSPSLDRPELFITRPAGNVDRLAFHSPQRGHLCATLTLPQAGRHTVEVLAVSARGPEVAALFFVDVGGAPQRSDRSRGEEAPTVNDAKVAIFRRINELRKARGLGELTLDAEASKIAQNYSDRMARENFFAHIAPDGTDLKSRAERAGYAYRSISENLGLARGPVAAHFGIEQSPGHLKALLEPTYSRLGIGIALQKVDQREEALVTEILASPPAAIGDPVGEVYRSLDKKRAELKLPALRRDRNLEDIAKDHARQALKLQKPTSELPGSTVHDRVFSSMQTIKSTSVDIFVSDNPSEVPLSKGLQDAENNLVGVGVAHGNTTYGNNKFWVVEIYAAAR